MWNTMVASISCSACVIDMRSEVFIVVTIDNMQMWNVMPCILVDRYQHFGIPDVYFEGSEF